MAKSKELKRKEAQWRKVRGNLLDLFRNHREEDLQAKRLNPQETCDRDDALMILRFREEALAEYLATPREWRKSALDGWVVPLELRNRIEKAEAEELAKKMDESIGDTPLSPMSFRLRL